jgi:adenylyl-sulfate kinase
VQTTTSGFVLWFTGLSGARNSTLSRLVATEIERRGVHVEVLDGDEVRETLSKGLGFSKEDRVTNIRRIGFVAKVAARCGACAIVAAISPYREIRREIRAASNRFCEVFCDCAIEVLAERDPKGLYRRALAGEIRRFTGVNDPYEPPLDPGLHLRTDCEKPEQSLRRILEKLELLGYVPRL